MRRIRAYVDTSVFSGVHDEEFAEHSKAFLDRVAAGDFIVLISQIVLDELENAPAPVKAVLDSLPKESLEGIDINEEVNRLSEEYIARGVLTEKWRDDAMHVAAATVAKADVILSWNFRHIVNFQRIQKFNSVNLANGYSLMDIRSPLEVEYVDED